LFITACIENTALGL